MTDITHRHDDAVAYERFMGRWSREVGMTFLDWIAPPKNARWLDVGCGSGAFTELVLNSYFPADIVGIDPSAEQIDHVRGLPLGQRADFRVADALTLPFPDGTFDVVASALVINFIPDRLRALAEMRRVTRPGGLVAGYVWDFASEGAPNAPIRLGMRRMGLAAPAAVGTDASRLDALISLFESTGFQNIESRMVNIAVAFRDFDDFWQSQTPTYNNIGKVIERLPDADRRKLKEAAQDFVTSAADGSVTYPARANAIKARVPE